MTVTSELLKPHTTLPVFLVGTVDDVADAITAGLDMRTPFNLEFENVTIGGIRAQHAGNEIQVNTPAIENHGRSGLGIRAWWKFEQGCIRTAQLRIGCETVRITAGTVANPRALRCLLRLGYRIDDAENRAVIEAFRELERMTGYDMIPDNYVSGLGCSASKAFTVGKRTPKPVL